MAERFNTNWVEHSFLPCPQYSIQGVVREYSPKRGGEGQIAYADICIMQERQVMFNGLGCIKMLDERYAEGQPSASGFEIEQKYKWLRRHNIPVPAFLLYDQKLNWIFMPDLTHGGKKVLVDYHCRLRDVSVVPINLLALQATLPFLADAAFSGGDGVYLDHDAYTFLIDKKTGLGEVCFLDIGTASHRIKKGTNLYLKRQHKNNPYIKEIYTQTDALNEAQFVVSNILATG